MTAVIPAMIDERNRVIREGVFFAMSIPVSNGTSKVHGEMLNFACSPFINISTSNSVAVLKQNPATRKMTRVMPKEGTVVYTIYLICSKRSTLTADDASMVVSLSGDILSPKYAPDMMAPAVHGIEMPSACPIPMSATPMVAIVVQELPDSTDTNAAMIHAVNRKKVGERICRP